MIYRLPEADDKAMLDEYIKEHYNNGEKFINASLELATTEYCEWLEKIRRNASTGDEIWGKSLLYLCIDEGKLVGLLNIRYEAPEHLAEKYGHIGYGVRPAERRKGYATAISICKAKGLSEVILGCYKDNLASAATIKKNGGILISETENEGRISQYYIIKL